MEGEVRKKREREGGLEEVTKKAEGGGGES